MDLVFSFSTTSKMCAVKFLTRSAKLMFDMKPVKISFVFCPLFLASFRPQGPSGELEAAFICWFMWRFLFSETSSLSDFLVFCIFAKLTFQITKKSILNDDLIFYLCLIITFVALKYARLTTVQNTKKSGGDECKIIITWGATITTFIWNLPGSK